MRYKDTYFHFHQSSLDLEKWDTTVESRSVPIGAHLLNYWGTINKVNDAEKGYTYSTKLSYSMAHWRPPVLSNLETSKFKIGGETEYPTLNKASRNSFESILPLLSRSALSNISCNHNYNNNITTKIKISNFLSISHHIPSIAADCETPKWIPWALKNNNKHS